MFWVATESFIALKKRDNLIFLIGVIVFVLTAFLMVLSERNFIPHCDLVYQDIPRFNLFFEMTLALFLVSNRIKNELVERQTKAFELQKDMQKQREQISDDLHDDVGSTLNSISVFSELAKQHIQNHDPKAVTLVERIGESARELIDSIDDIVWAVNPKNDHFETIVLRMRLFASELLMPQNIKIAFYADANLNTVNLPIESRKNFYLIFKEAINNVYKYAECQNLKIDIQIYENNINMIIADDGKGFDPFTTRTGNGQHTMKLRSNILRGYLRIVSASKQGTKITLIFPI